MVLKLLLSIFFLCLPSQYLKMHICGLEKSKIFSGKPRTPLTTLPQIQDHRDYKTMYLQINHVAELQKAFFGSVQLPM